MYRLVECAASALEVLYMDALATDWVAVDPLTGAKKRRHFFRTVEEEVQRAEDLGLELSLVSLEVDGLLDHETHYGPEAKDSILKSISYLLRSTIRPYDVLGLQDERTFGVLLVHTTASEAYLWAEKVRKTIAGHIIQVGRSSLSVTASIGIGGLGQGMRSDELLAGAARVLERAKENGGNLVKVL
jgi:diguanylate cyclase (GGDEF)-like protein